MNRVYCAVFFAGITATMATNQGVIEQQPLKENAPEKLHSVGKRSLSGWFIWNDIMNLVSGGKLHSAAFSSWPNIPGLTSDQGEMFGPFSTSGQGQMLGQVSTSGQGQNYGYSQSLTMNPGMIQASAQSQASSHHHHHQDDQPLYPGDGILPQIPGQSFWQGQTPNQGQMLVQQGQGQGQFASEGHIMAQGHGQNPMQPPDHNQVPNQPHNQDQIPMQPQNQDQVPNQPHNQDQIPMQPHNQDQVPMQPHNQDQVPMQPPDEGHNPMQHQGEDEIPTNQSPMESQGQDKVPDQGQDENSGDPTTNEG